MCLASLLQLWFLGRCFEKYGNANALTFMVFRFELFFQTGISATPFDFVNFYLLQVLCLHGGLSLSLNTLDNIRSLDWLQEVLPSPFLLPNSLSLIGFEEL